MPDEEREPYIPGVSGQLSNRANYRGDVVEAVMTQQTPFGADRFGALYSPVDAQFNAETGLTTVQFQPIPRSNRRPGQPLPQELGELSRQQRRQLERAQSPKQKRRRKGQRR